MFLLFHNIVFFFSPLFPLIRIPLVFSWNARKKQKTEAYKKYQIFLSTNLDSPRRINERWKDKRDERGDWSHRVGQARHRANILCPRIN